MSKYLPKCVEVFWDNGKYVAAHRETSDSCRHAPSGGTSGRADGAPCNRIIGEGQTRSEAIYDARLTLGLD